VRRSGHHAFDLYTDRKLRYGIKDGGPDPATLQDDIKNLAAMVKATMESWHGRKVSPVYQLLPNLQEPDWKSLRIGDVREFWAQHDAWEDRIVLARKAGHIGDVLVLATRPRSQPSVPRPGSRRAKPCARPSASASRWSNSNAAGN